MTKKAKALLWARVNALLAGLMFVSFLSMNGACASGQAYQNSDKTPSPDAKADKAMGVLPAKGSKSQTPLEKEAARIAAQNQSETALKEQNEKQAEEERKRINRQVAEDKLIGL